MNPLNTVLILDTAAASSALDEIRLRFRRREVMFFWKSGHFSTHTCRRRDMIRLLLNRRASYGSWANRYVLG